MFHEGFAPIMPGNTKFAPLWRQEARKWCSIKFIYCEIYIYYLLMLSYESWTYFSGTVMVTHISFWVSNIGDSMISSAVWTTNILKLCLTGMVCLPRLMACLFGAMVICMFLVENFIIVLIKQHKQCAKDTQKPFLLIGKESRIILMLSLGM